MDTDNQGTASNSSVENPCGIWVYLLLKIVFRFSLSKHCQSQTRYVLEKFAIVVEFVFEWKIGGEDEDGDDDDD